MGQMFLMFLLCVALRSHVRSLTHTTLLNHTSHTTHLYHHTYTHNPHHTIGAEGGSYSANKPFRTLYSEFESPERQSSSAGGGRGKNTTNTTNSGVSGVSMNINRGRSTYTKTVIQVRIHV